MYVSGGMHVRKQAIYIRLIRLIHSLAYGERIIRTHPRERDEPLGNTRRLFETPPIVIGQKYVTTREFRSVCSVALAAAS